DAVLLFEPPPEPPCIEPATRSDSSIFSRLTGWLAGNAGPPTGPRSALASQCPPKPVRDHRHTAEEQVFCSHAATFFEKLHLEELFLELSSQPSSASTSLLVDGLLYFIVDCSLPSPPANSSASPSSFTRNPLHTLSEPILDLSPSLSSADSGEEVRLQWRPMSPVLSAASTNLSQAALPATYHPDDAVCCLQLLFKVAVRCGRQDQAAQWLPIWTTICQRLLQIVESPTPASRARDAALHTVLHLLLNALLLPGFSEEAATVLQKVLRIHQEHPSRVPQATNLAIAKQVVAAGTLALRDSRALCRALLELLQTLAQSAEASGAGFKLLILLLSRRENVTPRNVLPYIEALRCFAVSAEVASSIPMQAMELLYTVFSAIPSMRTSTPPPPPSATAPSVIDDEDDDALWKGLILPVLNVVTGLCVDSRTDVRNYAMALLQRALLSAELFPLVEKNDPHISDCFSGVLFPLFSTFLPLACSRIGHPSTVEELRLRSLTLTSKIFLHLWYLPSSGHPSQVFFTLWEQILDFIELYAALDSDILDEAIHECLKNILLVMSSSGVFRISGASAVWSQSFHRICTFCSTLSDTIHDLFSQMGLALPPPPPPSPLSPTKSSLLISPPNHPPSPTSSSLRTRSAELLDM
ncbi:MAG: hypothetical protein Q8P67_15185, partial [archaeon]|nr:hypothetical protein [archaeon]